MKFLLLILSVAIGVSAVGYDQLPATQISLRHLLDEDVHDSLTMLIPRMMAQRPSTQQGKESPFSAFCTS